MRQLLGRDSGSGIPDRDSDLVVDALHRELHCSAAIGELERVGKEIPEHLVDAVLIPQDVRRKVIAANHAECDLPLKREHLERRFECVKEPVEVDLAPLELSTASLEPTDVEQTLYQPGERLRLLAQRHADLALLRIEL